MKTLLPTAALLLALCATPLRAGEVPFLTGRVVDNAGLLSPGTRHDLETLLRSHEDSTTNQVVVLTVPDLGGEEIETFAIRVAEAWKLGRKERDNGVLLLIAREERAVRIEVGRGLEGDLPDITCGIIIRREIIPYFRDGDFDAGVRSGISAILRAIAGSYVAEEEPDADMPLGLRALVFLFFLVVVGIFTATGIVMEGGFAWFLYVFLIPFWGTFPSLLLGPVPGIALLLLYLIGFPLARRWFANSPKGKALAKKWTAGGGALRLPGGSSGGRWSGGGFSSRSGGFSGGGGGFSGGGASGRW